MMARAPWFWPVGRPCVAEKQGISIYGHVSSCLSADSIQAYSFSFPPPLQQSQTYPFRWTKGTLSFTSHLFIFSLQPPLQPNMCPLTPRRRTVESCEMHPPTGGTGIYGDCSASYRVSIRGGPTARGDVLAAQARANYPSESQRPGG